ncbi:MAG: hypothetical protein ABIK07_16185 [Planctomycetota bacterium]|jgi:hypothetical protein|uniref:hypothetical protein n=1 Tax=uncultured Gimesia sp. TaxID=1678688 RepID=UPI00260DFE8D|nr:hypothetical protein [uncultured Gimesia sp.]
MDIDVKFETVSDIIGFKDLKTTCQAISTEDKTSLKGEYSIYSRFLNLVSTSNSPFMVEPAKTGVKAIKPWINTGNASSIGNLLSNHWLIAK